MTSLRAIALLALLCSACIDHAQAERRGRAFGQPGGAVAGAANEAAVCGDGVVEDLEECDDDNEIDGDGCSSTCTTEANFRCTGGEEGGAPSACLPQQQFAIVSGPGGNGTSLTSTLQPNSLEGVEQIIIFQDLRGGAADICSTTFAPFIQCFVNSTNCEFRLGCQDDAAGVRGEELRYVACSGAGVINCDSSGLNLNERGWDALVVDANYEDDYVRVHLFAQGPSHVTAQDLTCGAALPTLTDASSVTCVVAVSPTSGFTSDGLLGESIIWSRAEASPISDQDVRDWLGEDVNREGEFKLATDAPWMTGATYGPHYSYGDDALDGASGITINTVTNSTGYAFTVLAAPGDNSGTIITVNYTSDGSAVNTEIRDGLIADFVVEQAANPTHAIASMTAVANGATGITITGGRLSLAEVDTRLSIPAVVQDVSGLGIHMSGTVRGFLNTHLPIRSTIDTLRFGPDFRSQTIDPGQADTINRSANDITAGGVISNEFVLVVDCQRYDYNSIRCTYTHGSDIEHQESRFQYGWSKNNGVDWFKGLGIGINNNGWTELIENTVEPAQAPVAANFDGNTHAWLFFFPADHTQGMAGYRQTYLVAPTSRGAAGAASNPQSDTITIVWDRDGAANEVTFGPATSGGNSHNRWYGPPIQLLNSDLIGVFREVDAAPAGPARIATWRADASAGDTRQDEQWATSEQVLLDGYNDSPAFRPNNQAIMRLVCQDPSINGDVLVFATAAEGIAPSGGVANQMIILRTDSYAIDPTDTTATWTNAPNGAATTPTSGFTTVANTEASGVIRPRQSKRGTIILPVRSVDTEQMLVTFSTDLLAGTGATFSAQTPIGPESQACGSSSGGAFGATLFEHFPGRLGGMEIHSTCEQRRNALVWHEYPASFLPDGPCDWSLPSASWCRANDSGATNEGIEWGVFPQLGGKVENAFAFRFQTDNGAADKTLIEQGAEWSIRAMANEAIEVNIGTFSCETAAAAFGTNECWHLRLGYSGTSIALYLGETECDAPYTVITPMAEVPCDQDVSNTVPTPWPTSTDPIRLMINSADAEPCLSCFMSEIALWDGRTFAGVAQASALIGVDHASLEIDLDWDNDGALNSIDTDDDGDGQLDSEDADDDMDGISDLTDTAGTPDEPIGYLRCLYENRRATDPTFGLMSEDFGYFPNFGYPLNLDVDPDGGGPLTADLAATVTP